MSAKTLNSLRLGQTAYVKTLRSNGMVRRRLADLGFVPGTEVSAELAGPTGDPVAYRVKGTQIALRPREADAVEIEPTSKLPREMQSDDACGSRQCETAVGPHESEPPDNTTFTLALAGNPNTGKSTVFNALTGLRQHVGNWPGKTVSRAEGFWRQNGRQYRVVDLPGTYSLLSTSTEEEIARDFILFGAPDCTVVVVDASALERNLNLVLQILQITDRVVVCVNLIDEARRWGIRIDRERLETELGVPVVLTAARQGEGLSELKKRVQDVATASAGTRPLRVRYGSTLEEAIDELMPLIEKALPGLPNKRWIAMRLIDGGDERLREEIAHGVLANDRGRTGAGSLVDEIDPSAPEIRR